MGYLRLEPFLPDPDNEVAEQPAEALFAMCLWGEARGSSIEAKAAVAAVILNRAGAKPGRFYPATAIGLNERVRRVILKPWQFSCFNANDPNVRKLLTPTAHDTMQAWHECMGVAALALDGMIRDATKGSDHYFSPAYNAGQLTNQPAWADGRVPSLVLPGFRFYKIG